MNDNAMDFWSLLQSEPCVLSLEFKSNNLLIQYWTEKSALAQI